MKIRDVIKTYLEENISDEASISTNVRALKDLRSSIEGIAEDIDNQSRWAEKQPEIYKKLERDYNALTAVLYVINNNLKALANPELAKTSIFLYDIDGDIDDPYAIGAIHVRVKDQLAEVVWLGSWGSSGRKLMNDALAQARKMGATQVTVTAKWNSEGFYQKLGLQPGSSEENPLAGSRFTDFTGKIAENKPPRHWLRPGELRGSHTDKQLQDLGFTKSESGSWSISQSRWLELIKSGKLK